MPPREKGAKACLQDWAGHFLRSGLIVKDAELRPFLAILRAIQADFSALQTVWRREVDSNPRYRFGWCKSRRFRKLHGIKYFRESGRLRPCHAGHAKRCGWMIVREANAGRFCG